MLQTGAHTPLPANLFTFYTKAAANVLLCGAEVRVRDCFSLVCLAVFRAVTLTSYHGLNSFLSVFCQSHLSEVSTHFIVRPIL